MIRYQCVRCGVACYGPPGLVFPHTSRRGRLVPDEKYPEVVQKTDNFEFPGRGQPGLEQTTLNKRHRAQECVRRIPRHSLAEKELPCSAVRSRSAAKNGVKGVP
jgi:hypothetical protein